MCDQDHFEKDRQEYEALGAVTRDPSQGQGPGPYGMLRA